MVVAEEAKLVGRVERRSSRSFWNDELRQGRNEATALMAVSFSLISATSCKVTCAAYLQQ